MKSVLFVSMITFSGIFGIILVSTGLLENAVQISLPEPLAPPSDEEQAAERLQASLDTQRDVIQRDAERVLVLDAGFDVERAVLDEQQEKLAAMIEELATLQTEFGQERQASISKLAKVYGAMKPASAAPILETMDPDTVLEILRRMKDRQAAKLLAAMNQALASEVSHRMSLMGESL